MVEKVINRLMTIDYAVTPPPPPNIFESHSKAFFSKGVYSLFSPGAVCQFQGFSFSNSKDTLSTAIVFEKPASNTDSLISKFFSYSFPFLNDDYCFEASDERTIEQSRK